MTLIQADARTAYEVFAKGSKRQYEVPAFQRPFSWTKANVNDLWDDLSDAIKHRKNHFLGSIVLQRKELAHIDKFVIYDGQQRLTVVFALVAVVLQACQKVKLAGLEDPSVSTRCTKLLKRANRILYAPESNHLILKLSKQDQAYFRECVKKAELENTRYKSNNFLKQHVFHNLQHKVEQKLSTFMSRGDQISYLCELLDGICDNLYFVVIQVDRRFSAATLFETLNFRGASLKTEDLFKSLILSKAQEQKTLSEVRDEWDLINDTVDKQNLSLTDFLRVFWIAKSAKAIEGNLYRLFKNDLDDDLAAPLFETQQERNRATDYVGSIARYLKHYVTVARPTLQNCKRDTEIRDALNGINLVGGKESHPFLVAMLLEETNIRNEELKREFHHTKRAVIKAIEALAVRNYVCGVKSSGHALKNYTNAIKDLKTTPVEAIKQLIVMLKKDLPDKALFEAKFSEHSANKSIAMYLLHALERHHSPRTEPVSRDNSEVNLEHIMPRVLGSGWTSVRNYHKQYLNRLGNLTLISKKLNLTNQRFVSKRKRYYSSSNIEITRQLEQYEKWRRKEIQERQKKLARVAVKVWDI